MQLRIVPDRARRGRRTPAAPRIIGGDEGFSLLEAVMALLIVVILLAGLTPSLVSSFSHVRNNRLHRQATVIALDAIEFARSLTWAELALNPAADAADPLVTAGRELDGSEVGLAVDEPLVEVGANPDALVTYEYTETLDGHVFTVRNYVTEVEPMLRRVVVVVDWMSNDDQRRHVASTVISESGSSS